MENVDPPHGRIFSPSHSLKAQATWSLTRISHDMPAPALYFKLILSLQYLVTLTEKASRTARYLKFCKLSFLISPRNIFVCEGTWGINLTDD